MKAIIYNTKTKAENLQKRIQKSLAGSKGYKAKRYADLITHPTDGRVACPIEIRETSPWKDALLKGLSSTERNSIVELTGDWFPKSEL